MIKKYRKGHSLNTKLVKQSKKALQWSFHNTIFNKHYQDALFLAQIRKNEVKHDQLVRKRQNRIFHSQVFRPNHAKIFRSFRRQVFRNKRNYKARLFENILESEIISPRKQPFERQSRSTYKQLQKIRHRSTQPNKYLIPFSHTEVIQNGCQSSCFDTIRPMSENTMQNVASTIFSNYLVHYKKPGNWLYPFQQETKDRHPILNLKIDGKTVSTSAD